jgi:hypothetical protein
MTMTQNILHIWYERGVCTTAQKLLKLHLNHNISM